MENPLKDYKMAFMIIQVNVFFCFMIMYGEEGNVFLLVMRFVGIADLDSQKLCDTDTDWQYTQ